ncbi:hypothetical protein BDV19DRAFT_361430 [Aspergillus venezuelensis]
MVADVVPNAHVGFGHEENDGDFVYSAEVGVFVVFVVEGLDYAGCYGHDNPKKRTLRTEGLLRVRYYNWFEINTVVIIISEPQVVMWSLLISFRNCMISGQSVSSCLVPSGSVTSHFQCLVSSIVTGRTELGWRVWVGVSVLRLCSALGLRMRWCRSEKAGTCIYSFSSSVNFGPGTHFVTSQFATNY